MTIKKPEYKYLPADKYVVLNNDPSLRPVVLKLPQPPPLHLIDGYGLDPKDQRFSRMVIPRKLIDLEAESVVRATEELASQRSTVVTPLKVQKKYWSLLKERHKTYKNEIDFIRKVWWHRIHGYWFFNRGKPTYITGKHFYYLNAWTMDTSDAEPRPSYRDRDRKEFIFVDYCLTSTETFAKLDSEGVAIPEEDGSYKMTDVERRICFGKIQPKNRRSGNTNKALAVGLEIVSRTFGTDGGGIQSYSNDNAEEHFKVKLLPAFYKLPMFWMPYTTSTKTSDNLKFDVSRSEFFEEGLSTKYTYATTASEKFYDGKKLVFMLLDESGKCFGRDTKIRMYDGSVKFVQDIMPGDLIMGDDSTPRRVGDLYCGVDDMYRIIPNKGEPWTCNKEHILCLKASDSCIPGVSTGDRFNKTVKDFVSMKALHKKSSVLYRKPVLFSGKDVPIDPYMLGLWLGDGTSSTSAITNIDKEITDYLFDFANKNGLVVKADKSGITYSITTKHPRTYIIESGGDKRIFLVRKEAMSFLDITDGQMRWAIEKGRFNNYSVSVLKNYNLRRELTQLGVIENKHIPYIYKHNSENVLLELLAGIIDTDGSRGKGKTMYYEITQKRKELAYDIRRIALDLGFYANIGEKTATMKRGDGSVYKCNVYRVFIYGKDLWRIPCRVDRKKYHIRALHKNTRNPMHTGFSVDYIGKDVYYGFEVDGNRRFLLEDNTVVHNTSSCSVLKRHDVNKNCLAQGNGRLIHGYMEYPSTVDEMTDGAFDYRFLANTSDFYQRIKASGQTFSGLFRLFIPATEGLDGFIDSYGYSVVDKIEDYQKEEGFKQTAYEYLQGKRDVLLAKGDAESMRAYREEKKLFPMRYDDCWLGEAGDIGFDMEKIDTRMAELRRKDDSVVGRLEWAGGMFGGDVYFVEDEENGRFRISKKPPESVSNKKVMISSFSTFEQANVDMYRPMYPGMFTLGADPYNFNNKQNATIGKSLGKKSRLSDGGISVLWNYDADLDSSKPVNEWESYRFVLTYRHRGANSDEFNEDVLKAAIYFGAMVYPEVNLTTTYEYFIRHRFGGYLLYDIDKYTGRFKDKPGWDSEVRSKQDLFTLLRDYISTRCHKEEHIDLLRELKEIRGIEEMRHYDLLASAAGALLGAKSSYVDVLKRMENADYDLDDFLG